MKRNTSISLKGHFENFVDSKVLGHTSNNASDAVRSSLQLPEEERIVITLRKAILGTKFSGYVNHFFLPACPA
ncbi:MAG: type II toxin-antitoxin system ParD family antitoxin [Cyclobacteriaceae bacterium]|jgi:putative addiction module CopG family antidote